MIELRTVTFATGIQVPGVGIRTSVVPEVQEYKGLTLMYDGNHVHITSPKINKTITIPVSSNVIALEFKDYSFLEKEVEVEQKTITAIIERKKPGPKPKAKVDPHAAYEKNFQGGTL